MAGLAALARDVGVDVSGVLPLDDVAGGLRRPFVFAVCGEINAGKSALLNALFGHPVCRVNVLPETLKVTRIIHGGKPGVTSMDDGALVGTMPFDFLHDFQLIDTPGTNTRDDAQRKLMLAAVAEADLILCVLPVGNPWAAATWNALAELPECAIDRVVLVVQQTDLREAKDLDVIRGHMRDLSIKRLGRQPPVFTVSALQAQDAKRRSPADLQAWRASGMAALEEHIATTCCQSPGRWAMLAEWRDLTANALRLIEDRMEDRLRGLREHSGFLEEIEGEIDVVRDRFVKRLPHHLVAVADAFEHEAAVVTRVLSRRLRVLPSLVRLFTRRKVGVDIERLFIERIKAAVDTMARADAREVVEFCQTHWDALEPRVEEKLGVRLGGQRQMQEAMERAGANYAKYLVRSAGEGMEKLNVRRQLDADLRLRNLSLTSFTATTLVLTTVGAVCGALGVAWLPWIFCGLAVLFGLGGVFAASITRRRMVGDHQDALSDACGRFADHLRGDSESALRMIFGEYAHCLNTVREYLLREQNAIEPRQRRWQEMFLHLKAIEQEF